MTARLTLAAYTHFGAFSLRGVGMYHLVRDAWRRGRLERVIAVSRSRCSYDFDLRMVDTLPGESRLLSALGLVRRLRPSFPARWLAEVIFDHYAAAHLPAEPGVLVTTPRLVRTTARAKAAGSRTIMYGGHSDPRCLSAEIAAERNALGLRTEVEPPERRRLLARYEAHLRTSDEIIAISDFARATFVRHGFPADRVVVVPLGVDLARFHPAPPPPGPFTYLFVGHVDGSTGILKGLHHLLQAWSMLDLADARLVVCGKLGSEIQHVIRRDHPDLRGVEFVGPVRDPERYYRDASVLVFPTIAEGLGKVVLEAMATARPVIVTPVLSSIVRDGVEGFFVAPRDVPALADRMLHFFRRPADVVRMGGNARRRIEHFSWDRFSRQVADIVDEVSDVPTAR